MKKKKREFMRAPAPGDVRTGALTQIAYLQAGLVPPATNNAWCPPHCPPGQDPVPRCSFPRGARRKFRKEWRRAVRAHLASGVMDAKSAESFTTQAVQGGPGRNARARRRAIVQDAMVRRGEEMALKQACEPIVPSSMDESQNGEHPDT